MSENKETTLISSILKGVQETVISTPQVFEKVKKECEGLPIGPLPGGEAEKAVFKQDLINHVTSILIQGNKQQQGFLTEREYWKCRKRLEEALHKISKGELEYKNLFGFWTDKEKKPHHDFSALLYLHLGLSGGAFAIADTSKDSIYLLHNKALQTDEDTTPHSYTPFIDIPYRAPVTSNQPTGVRKVLDAMYISVRHSQTLSAKTDYSPEFYLYMPHLLPKEEQQKLLPYEQEMAKDHFKFIYCGVGEILFHLFAWRMLVHKSQHKGIKHIVDKDTFRAFDIVQKDFWKEVQEFKLPEADWMHALETKFNGNTNNGSPKVETIQEVWERDFLNLVDNSTHENGSSSTTMWTEYELMGLIKKDKWGTMVYTREFLELIRFALHIVDKHLVQQNGKDDSKKKIREELVRSLQTLESRLNTYYQRNRGQHNERSLYYPSYKNLKPYLPIIDENHDEIEGKRINDCLLLVVKEYLMEGKAADQVVNLLRSLHKKCRFPIIPYYYGLATGENHQPKEHLVFCVWDSTDNKIEIASLHNDEKKVPDSGVAFVTLTLNPIWTIRPEFNFMKNGNGIHFSEELSDEAYIRLFRLYDFFSLLARPIIDKVFYGSMIKKANEKAALESYISNFAHELGKITNKVFIQSNISLEALFDKDAEMIVNLMAERTVGKLKPTPEDVKTWKIIPDYERFSTWSLLFMLWVGRERRLLFDIKNSDTQNKTLKNLIEFCLHYAKEMHAGHEYEKVSSPKSYKDVVDYKYHVNEEIKSLSELHSLSYFPEENFPDLAFIATPSPDQIYNQNAFIRLLLAVFMNTLQHSEKGGKIAILLEYKRSNKALIINMVNPQRMPSSFTVKPRGTKLVMESCLKIAGGTVLNFDPLNDSFIYNSHNHKEWIEQQKVGSEQELWLTSFQVPVINIFQIEEKQMEISQE